jgi:hypothetical protein
MSGLTNYDLAKPTYAFSGETSEFEDVLMDHGVITKEQALLNKGMKDTEVKRVLKKDAAAPVQTDYHNDAESDEGEGEGEGSDFDDDDDDFLDSYRKQRLTDLKSSAEKKARGRFGQVYVPEARRKAARGGRARGGRARGPHLRARCSAAPVRFSVELSPRFPVPSPPPLRQPSSPPPRTASRSTAPTGRWR